jgi:hypothetical protein
MNYRLSKFFAKKTYTSDTTEVIDINIVDPISEIVIEVDTTHTTVELTAHPMAGITKIEIVDGSDVLYSLSGYEAEALDWYNNGGKFRANYNWMLYPGGCQRFIGLHFGRYLYDNELAFDPTRFTNPQLRITVDVGAGGGASSAVALTCWAALFDQKSTALKGFLMSKEIKSYTVASTVHEYTDLPTDYPYRAIYLRAFVAGTEPNQCVSNFKLSEDQDKRIPYDHNVTDIERVIASMYPDVEEHYYWVMNTNSRYLYVAPSSRVSAFADRWNDAAAAFDAALYDGDGGRLKAIMNAGTHNVQILVKGATPHCVYEIPCGLRNDIGDWWDVRGIGNLRADITGLATSTAYLFLQQLRPY